MAVAGRLYKVKELVQVESVDAGFEGSWFEAVVEKIVSVAPARAGGEDDGGKAGAEPRILYDVRCERHVFLRTLLLLLRLAVCALLFAPYTAWGAAARG